jgi:aminocarboxymuconate-semialdehyde decarboxylase
MATSNERRPVDIHAHYYPQAYLDLIAAEGAPHGASCDLEHPGGVVIEAGNLHAGPLARKFIDLDLRVAEMDEQGVQVHALSLTQPMVYWAGDEFGHKLAAAFNDGLAMAHEAYPERLVGLAMLPMQAPALAVAELERAAGLPGIKGIYMATTIVDTDLSAPELFPVFERIEALGLPVFLHPVYVIGMERLQARYYLNNLLGNPFESAIAAANLIFGGVLDRFPKLTVCLPHAGGAFPYLVGRINHGWKVRPECKHLKNPPLSYLRRFYYDTISHSPEALSYLIGLVGAERVMLGSDYCFDMGYERPVEVVTTLLGLDEAGQDQVLFGNARRLLGL